MEKIETSSARRDSFIFYRSFYEAISRCPADLQNALFRAVASYGLDRIEPDFSDNQMAAAIWTLIRPQLDATYKRYLNGRKGGAPAGNQNARKQPKTTEKQPNVNENVNVNDNDNAATAGGDLTEILKEWQQYRAEIGKPLTHPSMIAAETQHLIELSGADTAQARKIVREAIREGWKDLYTIRETPAQAPARKRNYLSPDDMDY